MSDAKRRQVVIATVAALEPELSDKAIAAVLTETVGSRQSLRRLAQHFAQQPDVLENGPTSTPPVLDRFTRGLMAAGAKRVRILHPTCTGCQRRRPPNARVAGGWLCNTCYARDHTATCADCNQLRRIDGRDRQGEPLCSGCLSRRHRQARLDQLTETIVDLVRGADPTLEPALVEQVVDAVTPAVPLRTALAATLIDAAPLHELQPRPLLIARLLDGLRGAGASLPPAACDTCHGPAQPLVATQGRVECRHCAKTCPRCGRPTRDIGKTTCRRCTAPPGRRRGACQDCSIPDKLLDEQGRCRTCRERAAHTCGTCGATDLLTRHDGRWRCHRCVLADELHLALGPAPNPALAPVVAAILNAGNALVTRRWLSRSRGGRLLARLAQNEVPLSHPTLDELTPNRSVEHLRSLLVAAGALEADNDWLARLERDLQELASTSIGVPSDRKIALSWLRWKALPRLRRRFEAAHSTTHCAANLRGQFRQIIDFLAYLHQAERTLVTCHQADIDTWFAQPGIRHRRVRPFLTWAAKHRHLPGSVLPAQPRATSTSPTDNEGRWAIARRLVHDPTLAADDRLAGALIVLYAQPVSRVAALTSHDLRRHGTRVTVSISGVDLELPEPFAGQAAQLPRRRRNGVGDQLPSPWLFPASRPDRHVSPGTLSARLRRLGIQPRTARQAALSQLATELPPALLARSIGISPATAARWAALTGGNWNSYATRPD